MVYVSPQGAGGGAPSTHFSPYTQQEQLAFAIATIVAMGGTTCFALSLTYTSIAIPLYISGGTGAGISLISSAGTFIHHKVHNPAHPRPPQPVPNPNPDTTLFVPPPVVHEGQPTLHSSAYHPRIFPPYQPLEALKARRQHIFSLLPRLSPATGCPILDALEQRITVPVLQYKENRHAGPKAQQYTSQCNAFVKRIWYCIEGLIRGKIDLEATLAHEELKLTGDINHPDQVERVRSFLHTLLGSLNTSLAPSTVPPVDRMPFDLFLDNWKHLLTIKLRPYLEEEALKKMLQITTSTEIPYPERLLPLFHEIATIPVDDDHISIYNKVRRTLKNTFPQETFRQSTELRHPFLTQLRADIQSLFQNENVQFLLVKEHLPLILTYIREQEALFQAQYGVPITTISNEFADLESMGCLWESIEELIVPGLNIYQKTDRLRVVSAQLESLPTDSIWVKYPLIKKRMGSLLSALTAGYYSNHEFKYPLSDESEQLIAQVEAAFVNIVQHFGGERPVIAIIPDTAQDAEICAEDQNNAVITSIYPTFSTSIRDIGVSEAIEALRRCLSTHPFQSQKIFASALVRHHYSQTDIDLSGFLSDLIAD